MILDRGKMASSRRVDDVPRRTPLVPSSQVERCLQLTAKGPRRTVVSRSRVSDRLQSEIDEHGESVLVWDSPIRATSFLVAPFVCRDQRSWRSHVSLKPNRVASIDDDDWLALIPADDRAWQIPRKRKVGCTKDTRLASALGTCCRSTHALTSGQHQRGSRRRRRRPPCNLISQ